MTRRKIKYSELAPAVPAPRARVEAEVPTDEVAPIVATPPDRPRAPLELARALAAARRAEDAAALQAGVPSATLESSPARGTAPRAVAGRLTPMRGSVAIARPTPSRASMVIGRDTAPSLAPPPAGSSLRDRARSRAGRVELLIFRVAREWFGVELAAVEEAIDLPVIRHVPEMPAAMLGVITVRGTLTSVYSPAAALGVTLETGGSALVFRRARGRLGLAVDDVDDVHSLDLAHLHDAPALDSMDGLILGVLRHRDGLLALIDADTLITACQALPVMETA